MSISIESYILSHSTTDKTSHNIYFVLTGVQQKTGTPGCLRARGCSPAHTCSQSTAPGRLSGTSCPRWCLPEWKGAVSCRKWILIKTEYKKPPVKARGGHRETQSLRGRRDFAAPVNQATMKTVQKLRLEVFPPGQWECNCLEWRDPHYLWISRNPQPKTSFLSADVQSLLRIVIFNTWILFGSCWRIGCLIILAASLVPTTCFPISSMITGWLELSTSVRKARLRGQTWDDSEGQEF